LVLVLVAELLGLGRAAVRFRRLRATAPIDPETGLRTSTVLYGILATLWARADRDGGHVDVEALELSDAPGAMVAAAQAAAPHLSAAAHMIRVGARHVVIARWQPAADTTSDSLDIAAVVPDVVARTSWSSAEQGPGYVSDEVVRLAARRSHHEVRT
jgi:hypothetical protein